MLEDELREEIGRSLHLKMDPSELLDYIRENLSKNPSLKPVVGAKGKAVIVMKDLMEVWHPVLKKLTDYGNLSKQLNRKAASLIEEMVDSLDARDAEGIKRLMLLATEFLEKVRETFVETMMRRILKVKDDLRPIMMPGSVGREEVPNLYMPTETYGRENRARLALQLLKSIAVGNWISVYFEGPFHDYLRHLISGKLGKPYLERSDIGASEWEMSEPLVALLRLLLWVYSEIVEAEEAGEDKIIEIMRSSSGVVYFTPRDRERYTAFTFPQLERFVDHWLRDEERRKALEEMLDSIKRVSLSSFKEGKEAAARHIEVLYRYLNLVAISLLERAAIPWEPLRRIVDVMIELAGKYDVPPSFHFVMLLEEGVPGLAKRCGQHAEGGSQEGRRDPH